MGLTTRFRRYLDSKSIIQVSLIKISISLFTFLILLALAFGHNYWEKETYRINYGLLSTIGDVKSKLEFQSGTIRSIKLDSTLTADEKVAGINQLLDPILRSNDKNLKVGYFDVELNIGLGSQQNMTTEIYNRLGMENTFQNISWNNKQSIFFMNLPLYENEQLIGYVFAYVNNTYIISESIYEITLVIFILALSLSVITIYFIRKYHIQIEMYLSTFCKMILGEEIMSQEKLLRLPELKPVLTKIAAYTDDLKHINLELNSTKQKLTKILEGISDGLFTLDRNLNITYVNAITSKVIGNKNDILGLNLFEVIPVAKGTLSHKNLQEALAKNTAIHWEYEYLIDVNAIYEYHAYPFEEGLIVFFRDITEVKRQNKEMARLERLNIIGQLAAGIGHEIRNPMTTVKGFLQLLSLKSIYAKDKDNLDLMISEIDRANNIITNFLSLSKTNADNFKFRQLNEIIRNLFPMLQANANINKKEVCLELGNIREILLNEDEIKQLILNIVRNGLEITPDHGILTIRTYEEFNQIILAIIDQGTGIPPEIQDKIGTPFFTTKETGTGLGLALSIGIAHRHKATFKFDTSENGTTFYFIFPT